MCLLLGSVAIVAATEENLVTNMTTRTEQDAATFGVAAAIAAGFATANNHQCGAGLCNFPDCPLNSTRTAPESDPSTVISDPSVHNITEFIAPDFVQIIFIE